MKQIRAIRLSTGKIFRIESDKSIVPFINGKLKVDEAETGGKIKEKVTIYEQAVAAEWFEGEEADGTN